MKITLTFPLKLTMETFFFLIISIFKEIAKDDSKYKK
jgi:hypothetical protein